MRCGIINIRCRKGTKTVDKPYTFFQDIRQTIESIPTDSIVSRTISREGGMKVIVFAFAVGQELSEHTASVPAIIQILQGEADLTVGGDHYDAAAAKIADERTITFFQKNLQDGDDAKKVS